MSVQQQQFINLFSLLILGFFFSNLYLQWYEIGAVLLFTLFLETFLYTFKTSEQNYQKISTYLPYSLSALATSIGVMVMLVSPNFWIYLVVISLALFQKHFMRVEGRHFFNPSNFALVMALTFFYDKAHIALGQLGDEVWLIWTLSILAISILVRVKRWIISLAFVLFYLLFEYLFVVSLDPVLIMEEVYYRFYSVSFLLFIFFMLTDPRATPSNAYVQIVFAFLVALLSVVLDYVYGFRVQHLFLSLFFFSLFTPLVEQWYSRSKLLMVVTFLLFVLASVAIISIENQTPYYFTMEN